MILIFLMYLFLASTFTIGQAVIKYINPIYFIGIRMTISGIILLGYYACFYWKNIKIKKSDFKFIVLLSLIYIYVPYNLEFLSLKYISSAKVALLYNLTPFITAILAYFIFKERMTTKKFIGLALGFIGFIPILELNTYKEYLTKNFVGFVSYPEMAIIISTICGAYSWIVIQRLIKEKNYSPVIINGYSMLIGGLISLFTAPFVSVFYIKDFKMFFLLTGLIILIGNIITYNLYGFLLKKYTTTFMSFAGFLTPLFAAILQFIFLGYSVSFQFFVSLFMVSCGLYLFYQEELRQGYIRLN